jgi:hypothetical protein
VAAYRTPDGPDHESAMRYLETHSAATALRATRTVEERISENYLDKLCCVEQRTDLRTAPRIHALQID